MENDFTSSLSRFSALKLSTDFLNFVLNNLNSVVLLLDSNMKLQAFNEPIKTLFSYKKDEDLMFVRCGEALGCANTVDEKTQCGATSKCDTCELRVQALLAYVNRKAVFRKTMERDFYTNKGKKEKRILEFSMKPLEQNKHYYLLTIINDITYLAKN